MWPQLILFLSLWMLGSPLRAQPVELDATSTRFEVSGHLWVNAPGELVNSPQEALARYREGRFQKLPGFLARGYQEDAVWLAFEVRGAEGVPQSLVAEVGPAYLDHVTAWQTDALGQLRLIGSAGDQVPLRPLDLPALKPSFVVQLSTVASTTVLLRLQTTSPQVAIVHLYSATRFPSVQTTEGLLLGVEGSAFVTMGVVALGMFLVWRERIYLLWLTLILVMAGQAFMSTGMAYRYLDWGDLYYINKLTNGFTLLAVVVTTLFASALFNFKAVHAWLHRFIVGLSVFVLITFVAGVSLTLPQIAPVFWVASILMMTLSFIGTLLQIVRRHPTSLHYGPMFLLTFFVGAVTMLAVGGKLPFTEWTASAWQVASLCNVLSLQVAMLSRALQAQRTHAQERANLLTQLRQQNQELEGRVERRTESLSKALQDVQQAESAQRHLLSMASHEFRTPAARIKASLDSIEILKAQVPPEIAGRLTNIRQASVRMIGLANDLINEDRLHELALKPHLAVLDLRQLVAEVVARYPSEPELVSELPATPLHIRGDAALLGIALHNLIDNALRHGRPTEPQHQRVTVTLQAHVDHVELQVADNGPGIPDSKRESVFERYHAGPYRDSSESDAPMSTSSGLGLSIVRDIAQAHGGEAAVRDVHPHGAMLVLILPL